MEAFKVSSNLFVLVQSQMPFWSWPLIFLVAAMLFLYTSVGSFFHWWPFQSGVKNYTAANWSRSTRIFFSLAFLVGACMFAAPWVMLTQNGYRVRLDRAKDEIIQEETLFGSHSVHRLGKLSDLKQAEVESGSRGTRRLVFITHSGEVLYPFSGATDDRDGYYALREAINQFLAKPQ